MAHERAFRHFRDPSVVPALLAEMRARHGRSYEALADDMVAQMRAYFVREFGQSRNPSRFRGASEAVVRERFLFGLSGGVDSSVVAFLAVRAVGPEAVLPVTMPAHPEDESVAMAALCRSALGLAEPDAPYVIDVRPLVDAWLRVAGETGVPRLHLGADQDTQSREQRMRLGNFGSRVRVGVLYDLQRAIRGRILGTGNRTEFCQGYSTKFGTPISYDLGVLDELYKVDVQELARALGVPDAIRAAAPSTGYFPGQTHEGELGATLEEQDVFAYLLFERGLSARAAAEHYGADEAFGAIMQQRWNVSGHKRALNFAQEHVRVSAHPLPGLAATPYAAPAP